MKMSLCQIITVAAILGLLFTPLLPFAHAHTEYETLTTPKKLMKTVTTTKVMAIYETHEHWSDSAGRYIKVNVQVGTVTEAYTARVVTGEYVAETVTRPREHTHWWERSKVIAGGAALLGVVAGWFLGNGP